MVDASLELQKFVFASKYARWIPDLKRRETWDEAVDRVRDMHLRKFENFLPPEDLEEIKWAFELVRQKRVLPSMRSMQFGGKAVEVCHPRQYNCCVRHVDSIRAFAELGFLMLTGTGTGIGLSKKFLNRLPNLVGASDKTGTVINYTIEDSIEGWADSLEALLSCYFKGNAFSGRKIVFDYSKIRKKGSLLKTSGGKAPGYKPLKTTLGKIKDLLDYVIEDKNLTRLRSIDVYDILMLFADCVVSGGIRRTASIVIFDKDDQEMIEAKVNLAVSKFRESFDEETKTYHTRIWIKNKYYDVTFDLEDSFQAFDHQQLLDNKIINWRYIYPHRARSNNSVLLIRNSLSLEEFKEVFNRTKQYGEPGFLFSNSESMLINPCAEVGFEPITPDGVCGVQFCNLVTLSGSKVKTKEDFKECVKAQTIIGTIQASYTNFPYLSQAAKQLTEEEALLGNSITGFMANPDILLNAEILKEMSQYAVETNKTWAAKLKINPAARICLVKPEGTASLISGDAPGIHPYHAQKFFRRVQMNTEDNVYKFFKQINPHMTETSVWNNHGTDDVITFPLEIKDKVIVKEDLTALQHLKIAKLVQHNWVLPSQANNKKDINHNVSITVIVRNEEWDDVIEYLYENRSDFTAVSFISYSGDKDYPQAPNEKVTTEEDQEKFDMLSTYLSVVDYTQLKENSDGTYHVAEAACSGGACLV
jgi:ribonucleoside-diphosphate reductase alpha chain